MNAKPQLALALGGVALASLLLLHRPALAAPSWWTTRGVLDNTANIVTNDYAPATLGQLKWMAVQARNEFDAQLPGGASTAVVAMLAAFPTNGYFAPATLGQGKAVAKPFYDQLAIPGAPYAYPWTGTNVNDYAPLLLGQLKNLFAIELGDADSDGMPDWWEAQFGLNDPVADADGDGWSNYAEYVAGTNPVSGTNQPPAVAWAGRLSVFTPFE